MKMPDRWVSGVALGGAALALSGCAAHHVGDDWQCPLVRGIPCQRVAEADPAGPRGQQSAGRRQGEMEGHAAGARRAGRARQVAGLSRRRAADSAGAQDRGDVGDGADRYADYGQPVPDGAAAQTGDVRILRTPEVIGRIWIAPYVDGDGVYREAAWVRVVLEPARWRHP